MIERPLPIAECRSTVSALFLSSGITEARRFVQGQIERCGAKDSRRRVSLMIQLALLDLDCAHHEGAVATFQRLRDMGPRRTQELAEFCVELCQILDGDRWREARREIISFVFELGVPTNSPLCLQAAALYVANHSTISTANRKMLGAILDYGYGRCGIPRPRSSSESLENQVVAAYRAYREGVRRFEHLLVAIASSGVPPDTLRREFLEVEPIGWFRNRCLSLTRKTG